MVATREQKEVMVIAQAIIYEFGQRYPEAIGRLFAVLALPTNWYLFDGVCRGLGDGKKLQEVMEIYEVRLNVAREHFLTLSSHVVFCCVPRPNLYEDLSGIECMICICISEDTSAIPFFNSISFSIETASLNSISKS